MGYDKTLSVVRSSPLHNDNVPEDDDQDFNTMPGNQHKHEHARGLPHRGGVSDLFGGSGGSATAPVDDDAVSAVLVWLGGMEMDENRGYHSRLST